MRTKEEILDYHLDKNKISACRKADYIDDNGVHEVIEDAMDEYAKEKVLDFIDWLYAPTTNDMSDLWGRYQQEKSSLK